MLVKGQARGDTSSLVKDSRRPAHLADPCALLTTSGNLVVDRAAHGKLAKGEGPQGSTSIDFTGVIAFFNRYTPMRTPVCLLLNWLVRFPDLLALPSTDLDITAVLQLITIRAT
jgi:hypothetical protein